MIPRIFSRRAVVALLTIILPCTAGGQIPVRPLGPIIARSTAAIGSISGIRPLRDGRVIVNDPTKRRLIVLDQQLALVATIADTGMQTARLYPQPGRAGSPRLFAYPAESTLFWDPSTVGFLVIGPNSAIARVVSAPSAELLDAMGYVGPSADARGALVYRKGPSRAPFVASSPTTSAPVPITPVGSDSSPLIRAEVMSHRVDTVTRLAAQRGDLRGSTVVTVGSETEIRRTTTFRLSDAGDDWAVTSDGSIAIIRGRDYHVDWINPDGSRSSTPKVEHQWTRLTGEMKQRLADSLRHLTDSINAVPQLDAAVKLHFDVADAEEMPDYIAPFRSGLTRADADGNLWICATPEGPVVPPCTYEIVNRQGVLVDRVQLPGGVTLEGFGPGVAYLSSRVRSGMELVAARIR